MKKLIFVDNDEQRLAETQINLTKDFLKIGCGLSKTYVDSMEILPELWRMERDDIFKLMFEGETVIVTSSVYTPGIVYNSRHQLKFILSTAGMCNVENRIYIDGSGMIIKGLKSLVDDSRLTAKDFLYICQAIANNVIVTYDSWKPKRVLIAFEHYNNPIFKLIDIDLKELLED